MADQDQARPGTPAVREEAESPAPGPATLHVLRVESLGNPAGPLQTRWGDVEIAPPGETESQFRVLLSGTAIAELPVRRLVLAHRIEYTDRDVLVGFANCSDDAPVCDFWQPVWIVLRPNTPPTVLRFANLFSAERRAEVSGDETGVHIALGPWDGATRRATLTPRNEVRLESTPDPPARDDRSTCRAVVNALEYCSLARRCDSFDASSVAVPPATRRSLSKLFHTTTAIDAQRFVLFCNTSCRLGFTPSRKMITRDVCRGAVPLQWARTDLGWLSREVYSTRN